MPWRKGQNFYAQQSLTPRRSMGYDLSKTIADSDFQANGERWGLLPGLSWEIGTGWAGWNSYANAYVHGRAAFIWACNRNDSALSRGALTKFYSFTGTVVSGTVTTITDGADTFVENEQIGNLAIIDDDAGASGDPPEGEGGVITKNTTTTLTIRTPQDNQQFSVAPAVGDTFTIRSTAQVIASAIGDQDSEIAGIVMASSLANNYWGWICIQADFVWALVKGGQAITTDKGLIADTGRLTVGNTSGQDLILAYAPASFGADLTSDLIPVRFRSPYSIQATSE